MRRRLGAVLTLIATVGPISACGSSAPAQTGSGSSGAAQTSSHAREAVRFAECMRRNGVSRFPDPPASGNLTIDAIANGSSLDTSSPSFTQALSACRRLEPAGFTGARRSTAQQSAALRFARCIRRHGVPDFPDPTPSSPLIDTNRIPSANQPGGMAALDVAMQKCGAAAAAAGVTR